MPPFSFLSLSPAGMGALLYLILLLPRMCAERSVKWNCTAQAKTFSASSCCRTIRGKKWSSSSVQKHSKQKPNVFALENSQHHTFLSLTFRVNEEWDDALCNHVFTKSNTELPFFYCMKYISFIPRINSLTSRIVARWETFKVSRGGLASSALHPAEGWPCLLPPAGIASFFFFLLRNLLLHLYSPSPQKKLKRMVKRVWSSIM